MNQETVATVNRTARLAGLLYLALMPFGVFGIVYVPTALIERGNAAATIANILESELLFRAGILSHLIAEIIFIFLALTLFRLLEPVNRNHAVLMVVLALVGIPVATLSELNHLAVLDLLRLPAAGVIPAAELQVQVMHLLEMRGQAILLGQIFWGLWLIPLGLLVLRSGFLPKVIGVLLLIAGAGYVFDSTMLLLAAGLPVVSPFTFVGELALTLWLLIKGVDFERWRTVKAGR